MNSCLWSQAGELGDPDWDDEPDWDQLQDGIDYLDGCPHCEQVKAGKKDVTPRYYSTHDYGFVHTLMGAQPMTVLCEVERRTPHA